MSARVTARPRASICVALVLALTACAHEPIRQRKDPLAEASRPSIAELERWTWPDGEDGWRPLREHELVALEQLVCLLIAEAESGRPRRAQRRRAATLAALVGVELHRVEVEVAERSVELWVVTEPASDRRGRGSYLIRVGELAPAGGVELLLQAPHTRFDKRTGAIALRMLLEDDGAAVRAVFINSAHRFRQLDGSRTRRKPAVANPADAAHNPDHPLARTTARVLEQHDVGVVQLHGFSRSAAAGDPDMIISSGTARPSRASEATATRLRAVVPEHPCGHFGVDTDRLGALQNVQGRTARAKGRCFVHIELSDPLRERLLDDRELRRRFSAAVSGGTAREFDDGCR